MLGWVRLARVQQICPGKLWGDVVSCSGLDWVGVDWVGLDCVKVDWVGVDWAGLDALWYYWFRYERANLTGAGGVLR